MSFVFGPVPSRRLGQSLGVDPLPLKTCNWNCVYCQLGRTVPLTFERGEYFPPEEIFAEVRDVLEAHEAGSIDWVTLAASGETTLYSGTGALIRRIKSITDIPVAVITNGSLLYLPEVRVELAAADAVLPTLDAGNARLYRKINRPAGRLTFDRLLEGMASFRKIYRGRFWLEVMLIKGWNDGEEQLREIARALERIEPDQVHISLPTRPPAETTVAPPDEAGLMRALAILGEKAQVVHPSRGAFDISGCNNAADAIIGIIGRHPMGEEELRRTLERFSTCQVEEALEQLLAGGRAQVVERYGQRFWSAAGCRYPEAGHGS